MGAVRVGRKIGAAAWRAAEKNPMVPRIEHVLHSLPSRRQLLSILAGALAALGVFEALRWV